MNRTDFRPRRAFDSDRYRLSNHRTEHATGSVVNIFQRGERSSRLDSIDGEMLLGMSIPEYLSWPDEHLKRSVAANYDEAVSERFNDEAVGPAVNVLAKLARDGAAVEFAVGTGRLAIPLAATGTLVYGIDFSEPMLDELRKKIGAERIRLTVGDMTETKVCADAAVVYLVFNTIGNLRTQQQQVACFRNGATHLRRGGCFVIENIVPNLRGLLPDGGSESRFRPSRITAQHVAFDEFVDQVNQILISHHYFINGDRVQVVSGSFRYTWPSELDLMAELAGLEFESRWADWNRNVFTADSPSHVSIWRKP